MALTGESLRSWIRGTSTTGLVIAGLTTAAALPVLGTAGLVAGAGMAALAITGIVHSVVAKPQDLARAAKDIQSDFDKVKSFFGVGQPDSATSTRPDAAPQSVPSVAPYSAAVNQDHIADALAHRTMGDTAPVAPNVQMGPAVMTPSAGRVQFARNTMASP